jgi:hypothetical protein|tara:strand:- start:376 stop:771 length:396 start_codon:yes stop_codon:yes gene_type:complete
MAATVTGNLYKQGKKFVQTYSAVWADTDVLTDSIVVNLSDLNYTNRFRIHSISVTATAGVAAIMEFDDATSDVLIYRHPIGVVGNIVLDFMSVGGLIWDGQTTSDTGDILVTSLSQGSGDEISIVVVGQTS